MIGQAKGHVGLTFAMYRGETLLRRETIAEGIVKIGKDPRSQIRLDDELASRMHAVIEANAPADITLIDLGNEPGTYVNGERVTKCKLGVGDELTIGSLRLVLEDTGSPKTEPATPTAIAQNPFTGVNPFASTPARANPFALPSVIVSPQREAAPVGPGLGLIDAPNGSAESYAMIKSGPEVAAHEVENAALASIEILVSWGSNVLGVSHLTPPRPYFVGDDTTDEPCDWVVPPGELGARRSALIVPRGEGAVLIVPPGAKGTIEIPGSARMSVEEAAAQGRTANGKDGVELALTAGTRARLEIGRSGIVFQVSAVAAGKKVPAGIASSFEPRTMAYAAGSFLAHMALVGVFAFFMPSLGGTEGEEINRDQINAMKTLINASAEREADKKIEEQKQPNADARESGGESGSAPGNPGKAGSTVAKPANLKYAVAGPQENKDPHLAKQAAMQEAASFGMIGIIATMSGGDPNAPTSPWGRDDSSGTDPRSANGNIFGTDIGESFGTGGLTLSGVGEGGTGGPGWIGLTGIGPFGHGNGGKDQGIGNGKAPLGGKYIPKGIKMREAGNPAVNGRLAPEVIQRVVRQNFGRFRACYEGGLRGNPSLAGRVAVKFAIGREGSVTMTADGGSDLPDQGVVRCVVGGFGGLSFPQPENGMVTVVYPLVFSPE